MLSEDRVSLLGIPNEIERATAPSDAIRSMIVGVWCGDDNDGKVADSDVVSV